MYEHEKIIQLARVAYMKFLKMPVAARDIYHNSYGEMNGKLFNLFRVVFDNSPQTAQSALITTFCEFAFIPGYILSDKVEWEQLNDTTVRGVLTDGKIKVSGLFYFNKNGFFERFETNDRFYTSGKKQYKKVKFSAITDSYKKQNDILIPETVKAVWHLPEGDYEYYKGVIKKIEFNVRE